MAMSIEERAKAAHALTWQEAQGLIRMMKAGLLAPPDGVTPDDQIAHLETAYPKPENVVRGSHGNGD